MSFFSKMGIFEKVAFVVLSPVVLPAAAAIAGYEKVTGKPFFDSEEPSDHSEQEAEARERAERQAKEKRSAEEREAIVAYAQKGLLALQTVHTSTEQPIAVALSFPQLEQIVLSDQPPIENLRRWMPQAPSSDFASSALQGLLSAALNLTTAAPSSDFASSALQEVKQLDKEIEELKQLRQAVIDYQPEEVSA